MTYTGFHPIIVDLRFQTHHLDLGFSAQGSLLSLVGDRKQLRLSYSSYPAFDICLSKLCCR